MLMDLLNTESAMTTRLAVSAIKTCINTLLNSQYHQKALTLLEKALQHVNNSYWLVKVIILSTSACAAQFCGAIRLVLVV